MPPGQCRRNQPYPLRWLDPITRQKCGRESTAEDDVSQPDSGDALCNSVPSLPSPPAFGRQHAARSKLQWRFSFNIQNVRLRAVGRAFLEKGVSAAIGATEACSKRSRRRHADELPHAYLWRRFARIRCPENNPGAYGARTRNLRRDRAAL
jgi:hypothetical protein